MDTQVNAINSVPENTEGSGVEAQNEVIGSVKKEETLKRIGMAMQVPGYPFDLTVQVVLTEDLEKELDAQEDQSTKDKIQMNILTNMLLASLGVAINEGRAEKRTEAGLIIL